MPSDSPSPSVMQLAVFAEQNINYAVSAAQASILVSSLLSLVLALTPSHKAWTALPLSINAVGFVSASRFRRRTEMAKAGIGEKVGIEITRMKLEEQL
jgi:hypothetical protein